MTPFPISLSTPITYAGPPPSEADVVVIGGGVIGVGCVGTMVGGALAVVAIGVVVVVVVGGEGGRC